MKDCYIVYRTNGRGELEIMIDSNGLFLRLSSLNGKDIEYVINTPKRFNLIEAKEVVNNLGCNAKHIIFSKFEDIVRKNKCKCSSACQTFIQGGCYNIPNVGTISVKCYERISDNRKLSPFQAVKKLNK